MPPEVQDRPGRSEGAVCADENQGFNMYCTGEPLSHSILLLNEGGQPFAIPQALVIPTDSGVCRSTELISSNCLSPNRRGPTRTFSSTKPARPLSSKRRTNIPQFGRVPKRRLTSGQLIPWAPAIRHGGGGHIVILLSDGFHSCNPKTMVDAMAMVNGFMNTV